MTGFQGVGGEDTTRSGCYMVDGGHSIGPGRENNDSPGLESTRSELDGQRLGNGHISRSRELDTIVDIIVIGENC